MLAFCMSSPVELLLAFCAITTRSAKTSAAVVKVTKRRTTRNLTLLFLLTDGSPPVDICARLRGRRRASAIVCDDLLGLRRRSGRRGGAPLGRRKGNCWKSFLGLGIVSHNNGFVARIFLQARAGDAAAAASDERRGQHELAEVWTRVVQAHAQRQRQ